MIAITLGPPALEELGCTYAVAREGRPVPDLVGRPVQQVEADLVGGCLRLHIEHRSVPGQPRGTIVEQDPLVPGSTTSRTLRVIVVGSAEDPTWKPTPPSGTLELAPGQKRRGASLDDSRGVVVEQGTPTMIEEVPPAPTSPQPQRTGP